MAGRYTLKRLAYTPIENKLMARSLSTSGQLSKGWLFSKEAEKKAGHSSLIADRPNLYEMLVDNVRPDKWDEYLKHKSEMMKLLSDSSENKAELISSWRYIAGDVNYRAMHFFDYPEGWKDMDKTFKGLKSDSRIEEARKFERQFITSQSTEYMKSFSFWPMPEAREGENIYDVRTYRLKPGSMYDWSNYWTKGLRCRQSVRADIPYGGFFSQLGKLHTIYHIWCYKDLADRNQCRQGTWKDDEWTDVVSRTVPLVQSMTTRILEPLPFSPTQ